MRAAPQPDRAALASSSRPLLACARSHDHHQPTESGQCGHGTLDSRCGHHSVPLCGGVWQCGGGTRCCTAAARSARRRRGTPHLATPLLSSPGSTPTAPPYPASRWLRTPLLVTHPHTSLIHLSILATTSLLPQARDAALRAAEAEGYDMEQAEAPAAAAVAAARAGFDAVEATAASTVAQLVTVKAPGACVAFVPKGLAPPCQLGSACRGLHTPTQLASACAPTR